MRRSVELFDELSTSDPAHLTDLAKGLRSLAAILSEQGQLEAAMPVLDRAIWVYRRLHTPGDPDEHFEAFAGAVFDMSGLLDRFAEAGDSERGWAMLRDLHDQD